MKLIKLAAIPAIGLTAGLGLAAGGSSTPTPAVIVTASPAPTTPAATTPARATAPAQPASVKTVYVHAAAPAAAPALTDCGRACTRGQTRAAAPYPAARHPRQPRQPRQPREHFQGYPLTTLPISTGDPAGAPPASQQTQAGLSRPDPARRQHPHPAHIHAVLAATTPNTGRPSAAGSLHIPILRKTLPIMGKPGRTANRTRNLRHQRSLGPRRGRCGPAGRSRRGGRGGLRPLRDPATVNADEAGQEG